MYLQLKWGIMIHSGLLNFFFFFSSRRRHTRLTCHWSSDVCSSDLLAEVIGMDPLSPDEVSSIRGQAAVAKTQGEVRSVHLIPEDPPACREAVDSIDAADWIIQIGRASCRERV